MRVYTRKGDKGNTSLYDGTRLPKHDIVFDCLGDIDELSSNIGLLYCHTKVEFLREIQQKLLIMGSDIATRKQNRRDKIDLFLSSYTDDLEKEINEMDDKLEPLKVFILAGTCIEEGHSQICRSVCRRVERGLWKCQDNSINGDILKYVNRLSDYFFVFSRYISYLNNQKEIKRESI